MGIMKRIFETEGKQHGRTLRLRMVLDKETATAQGLAVRRLGSFAQNELDFGEVPERRIQSSDQQVGRETSTKQQNFKQHPITNRHPSLHRGECPDLGL